MREQLKQVIEENGHIIPSVQLLNQLEALIQEQKQEMLDELWDAYKTAASMDDCSDAECVVRRLKSMRKEEGKDKEE